VQLVRAVFAPPLAPGGRWVPALLGVMAIVVGVLCLRHPLQTVVVVTLLLGLFWLVEGLVEVVHAIVDGVRANLLPLAGGLAGAVFGGVVLVWPQPTAVVLAAVFGMWLVVYGSVTLVQGFRTTA
jgi:uncharacterized membrane protein HdeD (DUF308 family)